ncbi:hypothetical protein BaRGS_00017019 [Batillaria attramentaria]|uniref:B box-type domain-containing protein n=1 Tax=Batillaria attramentaria TaxID=370345 RepID=A0ABD0KXS3_9CAEN
MDNSNCESHPYQILQYVCQRCRVMLCLDCLFGVHKGHPMIDIGEAAAVNRKLLTAMNEEVESSIHVVQLQQRDAENDFRKFETSVATAKSKIMERTNKLVRLVEKCRDATLEVLDTVASVGYHEQEGLKRHLEKTRTTLSDSSRLISDTLRSQSAVQAIRVAKVMKGRFSQDNSTPDALQRAARRHEVLVDIGRDSEFTELSECDIKRYIGKPALAQVSKAFPYMASVREFRYSDSPTAIVTDIYPMRDGKMCVVFSENEKSKPEQCISVHNLDETAFVIKDHAALEHKHIKMTSVSSKLRFVLSTHPNSPKSISLVADEPSLSNRDCFSPEVYTAYPKRFCLRKTMTGKYSVIDDTDNSNETEVFKLQADNPSTVCANNTGDYFAVIQNQIPSSSMKQLQRPSVALFKPPTATSFALFRPEIEDFAPTDICFHFIENQEKLLVADEANNAIYIVNFRNDVTRDGQLDRVVKLCSGCPWLIAPSSLAVDCSGVLWVGCRGGHILRVTAPEINADRNCEPEPRNAVSPTDAVYSDPIDERLYDDIKEFGLPEPTSSNGTIPLHVLGDVRRPIPRQPERDNFSVETETYQDSSRELNRRPAGRRDTRENYENVSDEYENTLCLPTRVLTVPKPQSQSPPVPIRQVGLKMTCPQNIISQPRQSQHETGHADRGENGSTFHYASFRESHNFSALLQQPGRDRSLVTSFREGLRSTLQQLPKAETLLNKSFTESPRFTRQQSPARETSLCTTLGEDTKSTLLQSSTREASLYSSFRESPNSALQHSQATEASLHTNSRENQVSTLQQTSTNTSATDLQSRPTMNSGQNLHANTMTMPSPRGVASHSSAPSFGEELAVTFAAFTERRKKKNQQPCARQLSRGGASAKPPPPPKPEHLKEVKSRRPQKP